MITYNCVFADAGFSDLVVPIRSFQMRLRQSTSQCYLSVVFPNVLQYASALEDRIDGTVTLTHIDTSDSGVETATELLEANIYSFREDEGHSSASGTVVGYKQITFSDTSTIELSGAIYRNQEGGARRYRSQPHPGLKPQHHAFINGDTLQVEEVIWTVSAAPTGLQQVMEIKELI